MSFLLGFIIGIGFVLFLGWCAYMHDTRQGPWRRGGWFD